MWRKIQRDTVIAGFEDSRGVETRNAVEFQRLEKAKKQMLPERRSPDNTLTLAQRDACQTSDLQKLR